MPPTLTGYLWCALAALASALATYFIKLANQHADAWTMTRLMYLGFACATYGGGFVSYSVALQKLDMSLAYPVMTGMAITMVAAIGYAALNEPLTMSKLAGMVLIGAGAFALTR